MRILLFGITRDIVGSSSLELSQAESSRVSTVEQLKAHLAHAYPDLKGLSSLAIAVNNRYAHENDHITPNDEIALIPPVSGG